MSDPNATIGPGEARKTPRLGYTQHFHAVQAKQAERAAASPTRALVESVAYKAVGVGCLWWGYSHYEIAAKTTPRFDDWVAIAVAVAGLYFIMPGPIKALLALVAPFLPGKKPEPQP